MEKRTYGPPTVTRVVPLLPELALLAGSDEYPVGGSAGVGTGGHGVGQDTDFTSTTSNFEFNHDWK